MLKQFIEVHQMELVDEEYVIKLIQVYILGVFVFNMVFFLFFMILELWKTKLVLFSYQRIIVF